MSGARPQRAPQRWPDVMIGVLTLALLGGFGALLLDQKPKQPAAPPVTQVTPPTSSAIPASPGTVPPPAQVVAQTPAAQTPATQAQAPAAQPATATTAPQAGATTSPADPTLAQTSNIPPVPKAPPVQPIQPPVLPETPAATTTTPTAPPATAPTSATPAPTPETPTTGTGSVAPRAGGAVAVSENRTPLRSDYRISLGSFATRKTVDSQTAGVSGLGYTIHAIDLGDQYVAQVGPFADEAAARQALADIQRAYPGALLYRPRNKAASSESDTSAATSSAGGSSTAESTTAATPAPQAAAPDGPRYLQVGAFDRAESAQKLVGILRDNNFAPTVSSPPERKTTVMVGPYSGDALLRAEARLDNAGLEHFRVK